MTERSAGERRDPRGRGSTASCVRAALRGAVSARGLRGEETLEIGIRREGPRPCPSGRGAIFRRCMFGHMFSPTASATLPRKRAITFAPALRKASQRDFLNRSVCFFVRQKDGERAASL